MPVSFNSMPSSWRVPGTYVERDGSRAVTNQPAEKPHVLLLGLRLSTGAVVAGVIKSILGENDGAAFWGEKSQIANMGRAFKRINTTAKLSGIAVDEAGGGSAAAGTFTVTVTTAQAGPLRIRIGDQRASISIAAGATQNAITTALVAAINALERLEWTAAAATNVATATARHKGTYFNGVTFEVETAPTGVSVVAVQPSGGATDPSLATIIAALDDERYDRIVSGLSDATNIAALEVELERRWGPLVKQPGVAIAGLPGSHGTLTTYGSARNSPNSCVMGSGLSPTPPWIWAAQLAARDAQRLDSNNPNRPRNGMTLPDCEAPARGSRFDAEERDLLLRDGISTFKVDQSGMVMVERQITTYQANVNGTADVTYLAIETVSNLAGILLEWVSLGSKYSDSLIGPDGQDFAPGTPVVTPKGFRGELNAHYADLIYRGRCKNAEAFDENMVCEINGSDGERLDVEATPYLVQGLVVIAMKLAFRL